MIFGVARVSRYGIVGVYEGGGTITLGVEVWIGPLGTEGVVFGSLTIGLPVSSSTLGALVCLSSAYT